MSLLAVVGPTASGKSAVAMEVARRRIAAGDRVEIVAVDAFTVYRGLDLGTAKPTVAERSEVPHHLIDVLEPWESLTVAQFQRRARDAIEGIRSSGATPLLVGGSGLYWRAVVDPLRFPPTDPTLRARISDRWMDDPDAAHAHLASLDPVAAAKIDAPNLRRTIRALEVIELTGERFSAFDGAWDDYVSHYDGLRVAYLEPDTAVLRDRIHARAGQMVTDGLLAEAAALRDLDQPLSATAAQAIGYAEAFEVLDGKRERAGLADAIATRTWRYAKRQRGWFRTDPRCTPTEPGDVIATLTSR